jgi:hypothetical protein
MPIHWAGKPLPGKTPVVGRGKDGQQDRQGVGLVDKNKLHTSLCINAQGKKKHSSRREGGSAGVKRESREFHKYPNRQNTAQISHPI